MAPLYSCLWGSMAPSVQNWKRHSPQSWRLQCFGKVLSWEAGTGQGALDLPPKFSSILWWRGRKDQTIQFKESSTQTKSWFRIFSPWMFANILLFTLLFPTLCVTGTVYLLSSVQWETTEETPHRVWGLNTSNTTATCCLWRGISSRLS